MIVDLCSSEIVKAPGDVPHRAVLRGRFNERWRLEELIVHTQSLREDDTVDYGAGTYFDMGDDDGSGNVLSRALVEFKARVRSLGFAPVIFGDDVERFARLASNINPD
ncbi:MAG TPA: hypothetical protein VN719_09515 [Gemmatimonadales bacterium]|nr:hypothetical protein [Gemmatimonadales bacterium]